MSERPERPIEAAWLALREPADARARDAVAGELLPPLLAALGRLPGGLRAVDLGAGTGANPRWLRPRLPEPQRWFLVDHDPDLLARPVPGATPVAADVTDLAGVLGRIGGADLVTAAALLDLLTAPQVAEIAAAAAGAGAPVLFALTVDGTARMDPADPDDGRIAAAFDAHQRRGGRLGPGAAAATARALATRGYRVSTVPTPWRLDARAEPGLVDAWLQGRAHAAGEQDPDLAAVAEAWLARRRAATGLRAEVGHADLLALPTPATTP